MSESVTDFETQNLMCHFKFNLANYSIKQYSSMKEILSQQSSCHSSRCMPMLSKDPWTLEEIEQIQNKFLKCSKECQVGTNEVLAMHKKHFEVTRLTYTKNITRCMQIHADASSKEGLQDDNQADWAALAHCIEHNTDKVDRRFFGYYNNMKMKMINKYTVNNI